MAPRFSSLLLLTAAACGRDIDPISPPASPPSPVADVFLTEIVVPLLPSPYYRFDYDLAGRITSAAYASDLRTYMIVYDGNRMTAMQSTGSSTERLSYLYDQLGRVSEITYLDGAASAYARIHLAYDGNRLIGLERVRRTASGFTPDKRMSFVYDDNGNLAELTDHRLPVLGQTEVTLVDRFRRYDRGINVDGFSLIHSEFFDHLVLLPGVRLQLGNPGEVTRTGGGLNYRVEYTYTYDAENRPLAKHGEGVILDGPTAGQRFQTNATFSYGRPKIPGFDQDPNY